MTLDESPTTALLASFEHAVAQLHADGRRPTTLERALVLADFHARFSPPSPRGAAAAHRPSWAAVSPAEQPRPSSQQGQEQWEMRTLQRLRRHLLRKICADPRREHALVDDLDKVNEEISRLEKENRGSFHSVDQQPRIVRFAVDDVPSPVVGKILSGLTPIKRPLREPLTPRVNLIEDM